MKENRVLLDPLELREQPPSERKVRKVYRAHRVLKVRKVYRAHRVLKDRQVYRAHRVLKDRHLATPVAYRQGDGYSDPGDT